MSAFSTPPESLLDTLTIRCDGVFRAVLRDDQWRVRDRPMELDALNVIVRGDVWVASDADKYRLTAGDVIFMRKGRVINRGLCPGCDQVEVIWLPLSVLTHADKELFRLYPPPVCLSEAAAKSVAALVGEAEKVWGVRSPLRRLQLLGITFRILALAYGLAEQDVVRPVERYPLRRSKLPGLNEDQGRRIRCAVQYISENYAAELSLETVAAQAHFSREHFCRLFRRETGLSPMHFVENVRIGEAVHLLLQTQKSVADVGRCVGYDDPYHFSRVFHRVKGVSPAQYREVVNNIHPLCQ